MHAMTTSAAPIRSPFIQGGQAVVNGADNLRNQLARRIANQDWVGLGFIERSSK